MPFFPLIVGLILGLVIGKVVFGGFGQNIFNPAAVGRIIIGVSFASSFVYTGVFTDPGVGSTILSSISSSPSAITDILSRYPLSSIFLGTIPGSMGEISSLLIILSCLYLLIRKAIDWRIVFSSIISLVIFSIFGAIALDVDILNFSLVQLFAGGFLFGAVFMATDPVTTPITGHGRVLYGFVFGLLVALIRFFGAFPEGVAFSILILNCFTPLIDYHKFNTNHKKAWLYTLVIIGVALLIFVPVIVLNYK
jgi:electron transport complex protein RnfD